jgi:hypothetical protein
MIKHPCHWLRLVTRAVWFLEEASGVVGPKIKKSEKAGSLSFVSFMVHIDAHEPTVCF